MEGGRVRGGASWDGVDGWADLVIQYLCGVHTCSLYTAVHTFASISSSTVVHEACTPLAST